MIVLKEKKIAVNFHILALQASTAPTQKMAHAAISVNGNQPMLSKTCTFYFLYYFGTQKPGGQKFTLHQFFFSLSLFNSTLYHAVLFRQWNAMIYYPQVFKFSKTFPYFGILNRSQ